MSFEDIDTPVSEDELSGSEDIGTGNDDGDMPGDATGSAGDNAAGNDGSQEAGSEGEQGGSQDADDEPPQERNPVIPRARFDEVNAKLHAERERAEAAERRLAEIEAASKGQEGAGSSTSDIDALEVQYFDAMMDGDKDKAIKIRATINAELSARAELAAAERANQQLSEREASRSLKEVGDSAIAQYPFLDHTSDQANAEAIKDVVEWRDFYASKGEPVHVALAKAVAKVAPAYATQPAEAAPVRADPRKQAALARNAADAAAQPPAAVAGIGNRAIPGPKVETQQDWEKLSDADREALLK